MINDYEEKVFFKPGDLVKLKLEIPFSPTMMVVKIERSIIKNDNGKDYLRGVRTRWFTDLYALLEAVFSTKDLILIA